MEMRGALKVMEDCGFVLTVPTSEGEPDFIAWPG